MNTTRKYFEKLLKVDQQPNNNVFPSKGFSSECNGVKIPSEDKLVGIKNSDLHLYVIYENNDGTAATASANLCSIDPIYLRPSFGRVKFNLAKLNDFGTDLVIFENNVEVTIHEIFHVLGFS